MAGRDVRRSEELTPIEARGSRWSPLALGALSLVCDPMFITSLFAITRATSELREVSRREAIGHWDAEHARVRSGAVWAIVLASWRVVLVAIILLAALAQTVTGPDRMAEPLIEELGSTELDEIRERLTSSDPAVRAMAADHLVAYGPQLLQHEVDELFVVARDAPPDVRAAIVRAAGTAAGVIEPADLRFAEGAYDELDARSRTAVLEMLARQIALGDAEPEELDELEHRLASRLRADGENVRHPIDAFVELASDAPERVARWWELDVGPRVATMRVEVAAQYCQTGGRDPRVLEPAFAHARARWPEVRAELSTGRSREERWSREGRSRTREAVAASSMLSCMDDDRDAAGDAIGAADPVVAVEGLQHSGQALDELPSWPELVRRLWDEPLAREPLIALADPTEMPIDRATRQRDLAESRLARHLDEHDELPRSLDLLEVRGVDEVRFYLFVIERASGERATAVIGPYFVDGPAYDPYAGVEVHLVPVGDEARIAMLVEILAMDWHGGGA